MSVIVELSPEAINAHASKSNYRQANYLNCKNYIKLNSNENLIQNHQQEQEQHQSLDKITIKNNSNFIEIKHFLNVFAYAIILDCRLSNEFDTYAIQRSMHIACRDNITKKRLTTANKLSVKDLICCEVTKKRLAEQEKEFPENELLIVLYDNSTNDENDLRLNKNPLQIVLDNIKRTMRKVNCKILEGKEKSC